MRVLPGRPKRSRNIDAQEKKEKADKAAAQKKIAREAVKKGKKMKTGVAEVYKQSRKGQANHCKKCGERYHNSKTCMKDKVREDSSQPTADNEEGSSQGNVEATITEDGPSRMETRSRTKKARHGRIGNNCAIFTLFFVDSI